MGPRGARMAEAEGAKGETRVMRSELAGEGWGWRWHASIGYLLIIFIFRAWGRLLNRGIHRICFQQLPLVLFEN